MDYAFDDRTLLFTDDTDFPIDDVFRHKNMLKKWDGEDAVGNMGFMEPLVHNVVKKPSFSNRCLGNSSDDAVDHLGKAAGLEFGTTIFTSLNKNESNGNTSFIGKSVLPRLEPSVSAKRSRITNIQSPPVPTCQVYGCNKDLSSSKDYHKRHKVCDVHSKTPVVIVNGIHQRFCQQCSRFHKVAEFDEGKRSCRKRLAGHNERRRKPQFDTHLGSTYFSTDASETSLIFSRILPGGFFGLQYNEPTNHNAHLKLEEDVKFGQPLPKSVLRFHGVGKQYPSKNRLNVPLSSLHEFSASSDSGSALSLLSRNSEGISTGHPLICKENGHANNVCSLEDSATNLGETCTFDTNSSEIPQELNAKKLKRYGSAEGAKTVNLMELSLHLQRIEQQKYYGQVKLENGTTT